jgi:hypothetical protein
MEAKAVIFLDWRQSGALGWVEARAGCGSIDFISGAEWIRAMELLELQIYTRFGRRGGVHLVVGAWC